MYLVDKKVSLFLFLRKQKQDGGAELFWLTNRVSHHRGLVKSKCSFLHIYFPSLHFVAQVAVNLWVCGLQQMLKIIHLSFLWFHEWSSTLTSSWILTQSRCSCTHEGIKVATVINDKCSNYDAISVFWLSSCLTFPFWLLFICCDTPVDVRFIMYYFLRTKEPTHIYNMFLFCFFSWCLWDLFLNPTCPWI